MSKDLQKEDILTAIILEIFKLNSYLISTGDKLVGDLGLTSARWKVLGAIEMAERPLSVANIAVNMGLERQGVLRIANELAAEGFIELVDNPYHKRSKLITLTPKSKVALKEINKRQRVWVKQLAETLTKKDTHITLNLLKALTNHLSQ